MKVRHAFRLVAVASVLTSCHSPVVLAQGHRTWDAVVPPPAPRGSWDTTRDRVGDLVFDGFESGDATLWGTAAP